MLLGALVVFTSDESEWPGMLVENYQTLSYYKHCFYTYPFSTVVPAAFPVPSISDCKAIEEVCLMDKLGGCCLYQLCHQERKLVEWVQCEQCSSWYHCVCIGISKRALDSNNYVFKSCEPVTSNVP